MAPSSPPPSTDPSRTGEDASCPFCHISHCFPLFDPRQPPLASDPTLSPTRTSPQAESFVVLSTPLVLAFLDITPLAAGHLLLCPRRHCHKLTAASSAEASELGRWLPLLSLAVTQAVGVDDWNIVQNNGVGAAQIVPHTHFHIIPRPDVPTQARWSSKFAMFGRGSRTELDEEEARCLADKIRRGVASALSQIPKERL